MKDKLESWEQLCFLAAGEQDPEKVMALVEEINELLRAKEKRPPKKLPADQSAA